MFGGFDNAELAAGGYGGFQPNSASKPTSNGNGNGGIKKTSLRALTIKQLSEAYANPNADVAVCDGVDVDDVTLLGKCVSFQITATVDEYTIDDGTGKMTVKWFVDEATEAVNNLRADCSPGNYIRVDGGIRSSDGTIFLQAYSIKPITDHNEMTHHLLNCIYQHLHFRKTTGGNGAAMQAPKPAAAAIAMAGPNDPCSQAILEVLNSPDFVNSDAGASLQVLVERLAPRFTANLVQEKLRNLLNEGYIYSTVDDNHFRTCM